MVWPFDDDLPRSSADIERLEGDPSSLRLSAGDLRDLAGDLETARTAAGELQSLTEGTSWQGAGFDAYRGKVEKNPKPSDIVNAQSKLNEAAGVIEGLAAGIAECQSRTDWCRSRLDALAIPQDGDIPEELRSQVEGIRNDVDAAREDYEGHLRDAGERFAEMTDQTVYAEPPPGLFERAADFVGDALEFVGEFAIGVVEGVVEIVKGLASIVALAVQPWKWDEAWQQFTQIVQFALQNPGEFLELVGKAIVDWDTLMESPGRWLGKLVPNILLAVATGGAGVAASGLARVATLASRFSRLSRVATKLDNVANVARRIDDVANVPARLLRSRRGPAPSSPPARPSAYSVAYEVELPRQLWGRSRRVHFNRANAALDEALRSDSSFASSMDELIPGVADSVSSAGGRRTPENWIWHHTPSAAAQGRQGVMQLVPGEQHTPGSPFQHVLHPGGAGGYAEWAIPNGAPPN